MAAIKVTDFQDIYSAVLEQLKIPSTDANTLNRVKRDINMVYQEVGGFKRWPWLQTSTNIVHEKYYNVGSSDTADVTQDSTTVTLSASVPVGDGSKAGFFFAVDGYSEIYEIDTHTAGSDTIELTSVYTGDSNATAGFKIWTNEIELPVACRETIDVRHDFVGRPMIGRGPQKLRELAQRDFRMEDRPRYYSTVEFKDPSSGDPETDSDRIRIMRIYPSVYNKDTTLHIDYVKDLTALDLDSDEPLIPQEHRQVLVYGALRLAWLRDRNEQAAAINAELFNRELGRMESKYEDSTDFPRMEVADDYLRLKRVSTRRRYDR